MERYALIFWGLVSWTRNVAINSMNKENESQQNTRREFLKSAGLATGAAGVAAVALSSKPSQAMVSTREANQSGYQETEHVKKYYELARF